MWGERRIWANPHANGGLLLRDLEMPDFRDYAVDVPEPAVATAESTRVLGGFHDLVGGLRAVQEVAGIEAAISRGDGIEPGGNRTTRRRKPRPAFANRRFAFGLARDRGLFGPVLDRYRLFSRGRLRRFSRRIRIVRRPLAPGAGAEHAPQPRENENREGEKYDRINVEHGIHRLNIRPGEWAKAALNGYCPLMWGFCGHFQAVCFDSSHGNNSQSG